LGPAIKNAVSGKKGVLSLGGRKGSGERGMPQAKGFQKPK